MFCELFCGTPDDQAKLSWTCSFANLITWLIRTLTGGPYSHVAILFSDGTAAEASGRLLFGKTAGVKWLPASRLTRGVGT